MEKNKFGMKKQFITDLFVVYPPFLVLIAIMPSLVGLFIHPELVSWRQFVLLFIWMPFFTFPFLYTKKKIFYYLLLVLLFVNSFIHVGHWVLVKTPATATGMFVMFNTNLDEALGFVSTKNSSKYFLALILLVLGFLAIRNVPKVKGVQESKARILFLSAFSGVVFLLFSFYSWKGQFVEKCVPSTIHIVHSYQQEIKEYRRLSQELDMRIKDVDAIAENTSKDQVLVLIIGESTSRNHMSLYGDYTVETNPRLSTRSDIYVFDDVISAHAHTMTSVPTSLTAANMDNEESPAWSTTIAEVFRSAGFKTYWLSNQAPLGVWDNVISLMAQQYEYLRFVNLQANSSREAVDKNSYDELLFEPFKEALENEEGNKIIVLHLMGTHIPYASRYPKEFAKFDNELEGEKELFLGRYRSAVYYNDFVIDSLLSIMDEYSKQKDVLTSAVYISDHGEGVYDVDENEIGHDYSHKVPKRLLEIPFVVWFSSAYKEYYSETVGLAQDRLSTPFMTDDLFHLLLDLGRVKTSLFESERSLLHPEYNSKRKRIVVTGVDYDAVE